MKRWGIAILLLAAAAGGAWALGRTPAPEPRVPLRSPMAPPVFRHALDVV